MSDVTIPEDVMRDAKMLMDSVQACVETFDGWQYATSVRLVALAILAERERCAKIAEGVAASYSRRRESEPRGSDDAWQSASMSVAAVHVSRAIRSSHE